MIIVMAPAIGYPGYAVSPCGRIYSWRTKRFLRFATHRQGYQRARLYRGNGVQHSVLVHRLVAQGFIPNPRRAPEVNHIDGDKRNNRVTNLQWVTSSENSLHAVRTGLRPSPHGVLSHRAKLNVAQVQRIRRASSAVSSPSMAREFGVTDKTIYQIRKGIGFKGVA